MTLRNGLFFENNTTDQHAQDVRLMLKALLGGTTGSVAGVGGATHFKVTEKAGTPDMSVDVAAGHLFIEGSRNSAQGTYHVYNDATVNVPLSASDPTNPRIDLIYVRVRDSAYDAGFDGDDDAEIVVAEGTPAAVPVEPTITDEDYLLLAAVTVGANVSSITDGDIEDRRVAAPSWSAPRGLVGYAVRTGGNQIIGNTYADLGGLEVVFDAVAGRRYKVSMTCRFAQELSAGASTVGIFDASNSLLQASIWEQAGGITFMTFQTVIIEPGAGSYTVKGRARTTAGSLVLEMGDNTPTLIVEDVGGYLL